MGFILMPVSKPVWTPNTRSRLTRFTQINADNLRAAEVCSAEATELPVSKRPPVSVASRDDTVLWSGGALFRGWVVVSKRLDPGSSTLARDDTIYSLVDLFRGNLSTFPPFHLSTFPPQKHLSTFSPSQKRKQII